MRLDQADKILDRFIGDLLTPLGFKRIECLIYARPWNEATVWITFPSHSVISYIAFSCRVVIFFDSLSRWLSENPSEKVPAAGIPIHLLRPSTDYVEWEFVRTSDLEGLKDSIMSDLKNYAFPFAEKYTHLSEIKIALESFPKTKDWLAFSQEERHRFLQNNRFLYSLDADQQVCLRAAIRLIEGDKAGALKIVDDTLLERKDALPKRRYRIEEFRKRIQDAG
ncbi:MAG TPA: hypothetical protein VMG59_00650 [Phycisphaerae bacterium]|nr:hypothetical protein [Phycisphaerae bacterium]